MAAEPDEDGENARSESFDRSVNGSDQTGRANADVAARNPTPASRSLTYEDGLRHAHDYLRGQSQTNPFAGRSEYGDLAAGNKPAPYVPTPAVGGLGQQVRATPTNTIGTQPENVLGPNSPGGIFSGGIGGRNVVKETMSGPGSASNQTNFPAGLPRAPSSTPEVGGTKAVPQLRSRIQSATEPSKPAFFGG